LSRTPLLSLRRRAVDPIRRGHPWVWREAVERLEGAPKTGDEVRIADPDGQTLGRGLYEADAPIAARVHAAGDVPLDGPYLERRLVQAFDRRRALLADTGTTAFRLLHGEGDRVPGFVVDRYGDVAILRTDGEAARVRASWMARALAPLAGEHGIRTLVHRTPSRGQAPELAALFGPEPPDTIVVREHGVPMHVDLARGQKTGAFLDQRENRRRVGAMARSARVLNLFSYAGGFSLHAALGGASRVTSVDVASGAHASAQASFRAAGVDAGAHEFVTADAFAFLEDAAKRGKKWDLVVSDPPSFAPNERALPKAMAAYRRLHRLCAAVLAQGGTLCAASCSSHVGPEDFLLTLDDASLGRADLSVVDVFGPPEDHPVLAAFPEGRYLKFVVLR
jgi:23S rRNA (cytosine1962-C5)-methyltransferase